MQPLVFQGTAYLPSIRGARRLDLSPEEMEGLEVVNMIPSIRTSKPTNRRCSRNRKSTYRGKVRRNKIQLPYAEQMLRAELRVLKP